MQYFGFDKPLGQFKIFGFGGAEYDPVEIFKNGRQGLVYDFRPNYLFQDAEGTIPVTANGDPVGKILDRSGNGNHAIQPVSASRPTYHTDGTLHWIESDGVDDSVFVPNSKESFSFLHNGMGSSVAVATSVADGRGYSQVISSQPGSSTEIGFSLTYANRLTYGNEDNSLLFNASKGVAGSWLFQDYTTKVFTVPQAHVVRCSIKYEDMKTNVGVTFDKVVNKRSLNDAPSKKPSTYDVTLFGLYRSGVSKTKIYGVVIIDSVLDSEQGVKLAK